jgi:hypothetical protein
VAALVSAVVNVRFEVFCGGIMNVTVLWDETPCNLEEPVALSSIDECSRLFLDVGNHLPNCTALHATLP